MQGSPTQAVMSAATSTSANRGQASSSSFASSENSAFVRVPPSIARPSSSHTPPEDGELPHHVPNHSQEEREPGELTSSFYKRLHQPNLSAIPPHIGPFPLMASSPTYLSPLGGLLPPGGLPMPHLQPRHLLDFSPGKFEMFGFGRDPRLPLQDFWLHRSRMMSEPSPLFSPHQLHGLDLYYQHLQNLAKRAPGSPEAPRKVPEALGLGRYRSRSPTVNGDSSKANHLTASDSTQKYTNNNTEVKSDEEKSRKTGEKEKGAVIVSSVADSTEEIKEKSKMKLKRKRKVEDEENETSSQEDDKEEEDKEEEEEEEEDVEEDEEEEEEEERQSPPVTTPGDTFRPYLSPTSAPPFSPAFLPPPPMHHSLLAPGMAPPTPLLPPPPPLGLLHPAGIPSAGRRPRDPTKPPPVKKYKCDLCGKAFSRSNTLVTHRVSACEHSFSFMVDSIMLI